MLRTFIAIELHGAVRKPIEGAIRRLAAMDADVKWTEPENIHLTLHFLGDVLENESPRIIAAVDRAVRSLPPFPVEIGTLGAFPNPHRPRTLWVGVNEGAEAVGVVHECVGNELRELGYRTEHRRFVPHATIGRVRSPRHMEELAAALAEQRDFVAGDQIIDEVTVFSSELRPQGSLYTPLGHVSLNG